MYNVSSLLSMPHSPPPTPPPSSFSFSSSFYLHHFLLVRFLILLRRVFLALLGSASRGEKAILPIRYCTVPPLSCELRSRVFSPIDADAKAERTTTQAGGDSLLLYLRSLAFDVFLTVRCAVPCRLFSLFCAYDIRHQTRRERERLDCSEGPLPPPPPTYSS